MDSQTAGEGLQELLERILRPDATQLINLASALLLILVGRLLAGLLSRWLRRNLTRTPLDVTWAQVIANLTFYVVLLLALILGLNRVGVSTTSLVAVLGAATLAVGLALQDHISNLAAGFLIIFLRPYRVRDYVVLEDVEGYVTEIRMYHTLLTTRDNKSVYVPNNDVLDGKIVNYSDTELIRLDLEFNIGYGEDLAAAKRILLEVAASDSRVRRQPAPIAAVKELADSAVTLTIRPYVVVEDEVEVTFYINEQVKMRFDQEGIIIPFPQRTVKLVRDE